MKPEALKLVEIVEMEKAELRRVQNRLFSAETNLRDYQTQCHHNFNQTYYPIITEPCTISGDPPGTMGVDWMGPVHVDRKVEDQWKRHCDLCNLTEYTKNVTQEVTRKPKW